MTDTKLLTWVAPYLWMLSCLGVKTNSCAMRTYACVNQKGKEMSHVYCVILIDFFMLKQGKIASWNYKQNLFHQKPCHLTNSLMVT